MTKNDLKQIVKNNLDFTLFHGKRSFDIEDYEYTFTITTYDNRVAEVQLKFPYGELRYSTAVDNRKDIVHFFTDFIWRMFVENKELVNKTISNAITAFKEEGTENGSN